MTRPATDEQMARWGAWLSPEGRALVTRVRAEREGRLRAEARVRALEEALGEALEALREPRAEKAEAALAEIYEWADAGEPDEGDMFAAGASYAAAGVRTILEEHRFGGGS